MEKISLYTVCMNRGHHLKETLPRNISENISYPNLEFVILDYNSQDGIDEWVKENLMNYIEGGLIKYYKTYEPTVFSLSHSKNMALRLTTGDILCQLDADSFSGPDYAHWISSVFNKYGSKAIATTLRPDSIPYPNLGGKLAFSKRDVTQARGFDEAMVDYGMEDIDLVNRLEKIGGARVYIENDEYLKCIAHSDVERLENYSLFNKVLKIYMTLKEEIFVDREVIYLLKDNQCYKIYYEYHEELKDQPSLSLDGWLIKKGGFQKGTYSCISGKLELYFDGVPTDNYTLKEGTMVDSYNPVNVFFEVTKEMKYFPQSDSLFTNLLIAISECLNRDKFKENDKNADAVNAKGWGKGQVYLNFDLTKPVVLP
jgi:glycosyltransferase involved in cell wall biosynthesis